MADDLKVSMREFSGSLALMASPENKLVIETFDAEPAVSLDPDCEVARIILTEVDRKLAVETNKDERARLEGLRTGILDQTFVWTFERDDTFPLIADGREVEAVEFTGTIKVEDAS